MNAHVVWIGIRPARKAPVESRSNVYADEKSGLSGDHPTNAHRQVTLISQEALANVAARLGIDTADPAKTRRNILISGMNFDLGTGVQLQIGDAVIEITGPCLPCERMEEAFGEGGRLAMADAGGLTGRILVSGSISVGDPVELVSRPVLSTSEL